MTVCNRGTAWVWVASARGWNHSLFLATFGACRRRTTRARSNRRVASERALRGVRRRHAPKVAKNRHFHEPDGRWSGRSKKSLKRTHACARAHMHCARRAVCHRYSLNAIFLATFAEKLPKIARRAVCHRYSLNVYRQGGHFKKHKDTPRGESMLGTLLIRLPAFFTGGTRPRWPMADG